MWLSELGQPLFLGLRWRKQIRPTNHQFPLPLHRDRLFIGPLCDCPSADSEEASKRRIGIKAKLLFYKLFGEFRLHSGGQSRPLDPIRQAV